MNEKAGATNQQPFRSEGHRRGTNGSATGGSRPTSRAGTSGGRTGVGRGATASPRRATGPRARTLVGNLLVALALILMLARDAALLLARIVVWLTPHLWRTMFWLGCGVLLLVDGVWRIAWPRRRSASRVRPARHRPADASRIGAAVPAALGASLVVGAVWLSILATSHAPAASAAAALAGPVNPVSSTTAASFAPARSDASAPVGAVAASAAARAAPAVAAASPPLPATTASCVPTAPYSSRLAAIVDAELRTRPGTYGIGVLNLDSGEGYLLNANQRFPAGSVYKLAVLYEAWQRVQNGGLALDTTLTITPADTVEPEPAGGPALGATITVRDALESMVTFSSNSAAHALIRTLGRDSINRSMRGLGLRDTIIPTPETLTGIADEDGNDVATTSPRDALCYMSRLGHDQLVSPDASAGMRGILLRQQINDRLPAFLPDEARVAHKTGEISGVRNDVGIVYAPHGAWAVAVLSRDVDEGEATAVIARLSRRLYDTFGGQPAATAP